MLTRQLNERQRMQYLEALGMDTFVPRWVLPGAANSRQCLLPESSSEFANHTATAAAVPDVTAAAPGAQANPRSPRDSASTVGALVDQLLDARPAVERPAGREVTEQVEPKARPKPGDEAAFSLAFWRVHKDVMVVDTRRPQLLPTEALLSSLLAAHNLGGRMPRAELQTWPLPGGGDKSWGAAREMIHAFLEGRLLSDPIRFLLLMGSEAARAVVEQPPSELGLVKLDSFACDAIVTPSLADMLLQPSQKRQVWQLLAPLRQHLSQ